MNHRKVFHDSVTELPEQPSPTPSGLKVNARGVDHGDEQLTVSFSLAIHPKVSDQLEALVASGAVVPVQELNTTYAVGSAEVDPLVTWLTKQGFDNIHVSPDRMSVYARASVSQIEKSLGVEMVRVTRSGITYTATRNAPSLPAEISASVHAIGGLQPFRHANKHFRRMMPKNRLQDPATDGNHTHNMAAPGVPRTPLA